jgi:hypothetical protein
LTNSVGLHNAVGHAMVKTHPVSHNPLVAYKDSASKIRLTTVDKDTGNILNDWVSTSAYVLGPTLDCQGACNTQPANGFVPKCGGCSSTDCGGQGCMNISDNVYLSTASVNSQSYAYLTFTDRCSASQNVNQPLKGRTLVLNITNPTPTLLTELTTSTCSSNNVDFELVGEAQYWQPNGFRFAWGFYRQPSTGGACATAFTVRESLDPINLVTSNVASYTIGPSLRIGSGHSQTKEGQGLGDYMSAARHPWLETYGFTFAFTGQVDLGASTPNCPNSPSAKVMCQTNWRALGIYAVDVQ